MRKMPKKITIPKLPVVFDVLNQYTISEIVYDSCEEHCRLSEGVAPEVGKEEHCERCPLYRVKKAVELNGFQAIAVEVEDAE